MPPVLPVISKGLKFQQRLGSSARSWLKLQTALIGRKLTIKRLHAPFQTGTITWLSHMGGHWAPGRGQIKDPSRLLSSRWSAGLQLSYSLLVVPLLSICRDGVPDIPFKNLTGKAKPKFTHASLCYFWSSNAVFQEKLLKGQRDDSLLTPAFHVLGASPLNIKSGVWESEQTTFPTLESPRVYCESPQNSLVSFLINTPHILGLFVISGLP